MSRDVKARGKPVKWRYSRIGPIGGNVMAHFIPMSLPGAHGQTVYVNLDRVQYLRPLSAHPEQTTVHFDGEQSLVVDRHAADIAAAANSWSALEAPAWGFDVRKGIRRINMNLKDWQLAREMFETAKAILPEAGPAVWNILGLALTLPGILFLFLFGMPFHVPRHGARYMQLRERDKYGPLVEALLLFLSCIGLILIILGTLSQMWASALEIMRP
jgi:hypothetical protein